MRDQCMGLLRVTWELEKKAKYLSLLFCLTGKKQDISL